MAFNFAISSRVIAGLYIDEMGGYYYNAKSFLKNEQKQMKAINSFFTF